VLAAFKKLKHLSLLENPVAKNRNFRRALHSSRASATNMSMSNASLDDNSSRSSRRVVLHRASLHSDARSDTCACRLYVIYRLKQVRVLNFKKVSVQVRLSGKSVPLQALWQQSAI
jgi:hypothetical protein